jgi:hypothetical protein
MSEAVKWQIAGWTIEIRFTAQLFHSLKRPDRLQGLSCSRGLFKRGQSGRRVKLTTQLHLIPRRRMRGPWAPLPYSRLWCGECAQWQLYLNTSTNTRYRHVGAKGERDNKSDSLSASVLGGGERSASRPGRQERTHSTHWIGDCGLQSGSEGKILCLCRGSNPSRPVCSGPTYIPL